MTFLSFDTKIIVGCVTGLLLSLSGALCSDSVACEWINNITAPEGRLSVSSASCRVWVLTSQPPNGITLSIPALHLPNNIPSQCDQSYVRVMSTDRLVNMNICLTANPTVVTYPKSLVVTVRWTDSNTTHAALPLNMEYFIGVTGPTLKSCGSTHFVCQSESTRKCIPLSWYCNGVHECTDHSDELGCPDRVLPGAITDGYISTPLYPGPYLSNAVYTWNISVPQTACLSTVKLTIGNLSISTGDKIQVYDGRTTDSRLLTTLLRSSLLSSISSTGLHMYVELRTSAYKDQPDQALGFMATYRQESLYAHCGHGDTGCYPTSARCDWVWDCPHGGDERGCAPCDHAPNVMRCSSVGKCYSDADRCTGVAHCEDAADEQNCTADVCGPFNGTFLCSNRLCIYESFVCDGDPDCADASDELNCRHGLASRKVIIAAVLGSLLCIQLLVLALACVVKLHNARTARPRRSRYLSPVSRIERELWRRYSAPPLYDEAMRTSRPYDEMVSILQQCFAPQPPTEAAAVSDDDDSLIDITGDDLPQRSQPDGSSEAPEVMEGQGQAGKTVTSADQGPSDQQKEEAEEQEEQEAELTLTDDTSVLIG